jgi:hypothetical protein
MPATQEAYVLLQAVHTGVIEHASNNIMYSFALLFAGLVSPLALCAASLLSPPGNHWACTPPPRAPPRRLPC